MKKGFTLIELLVVIATIAILAIVVILTINPGALLQQGRDVTRVSDMGTLNKAVSLYYQSAMDNPSTLFMGTSSVVYVSIPDPTAPAPAGNQCTGISLPTLPTGYTYHCAASSTYTKTDGTGWIPVNLNSYSAGSVISQLPVDPTNSSSSRLYYTYITNGSQFEVTAAMESAKYKLGGSNDLISGDGGILASVYEKGTQLGLEPLDYGDPSLVGFWPMNEGVGSTTADWSGNGNTGAWSGTPSGANGTYYGAGNVGPYAGYFNGTNNYVQVADAAVLHVASAFTVNFWINQAALHNFNGLVSKTTSNTPAPWDSYISSAGVLSFWVGRTSGSTSITTTVSSTATWVMITLWFNGSTMAIYVNGVLTTGPTSIGSVVVADGGTPIRIGSRNDGATLMHGSINDVRLYNRALSPAEIKAIYTAGK